MTVRTHNPAAARTPGSEYGGHCASGDRLTKAPRSYGAGGDLCQLPGCHFELSRFNDRDHCYFHGVPGRKRNPRKRGEVASAGGTTVTNAAPPPRRMTMEEMDKAMNKRRADGETKASVLAYFGIHDSGTVAEVAKFVDVNQPSAQKHLTTLLEDGKVSRRKVGQAMVYALRDDPAAKVVRDESPEPSSDCIAADCECTASYAEECVGYVSSEDAQEAPDCAAQDSTPEHPADHPAAPAPPAESPAAGVCEAMCEGISEMVNVTFAGGGGGSHGGSGGGRGGSIETRWFEPPQSRNVVTVEIPLDAIVEAVMERIAERMTRQERRR